MVVSTGKEYQSRAFCGEVLGDPGLLKGKGFPPRPDSPAGQEFREAVQAIVGTKPRDHWLAECEKHSIPIAPASSYNMIKDPESTVGRHLRANNYIREEEHRDWGRITVVGQPTIYEGTPNGPVEGSWHAPDIGEHTKSVLTGLLGYSEGQASEMMKEGAVNPPARGAYASKKRR